jgi:hypothetical protein
MSIQTATTADLEKASNVVIAKARLTEEYNMPCSNLIEHFKLAKGQKQITVPKAAQMTAANLNDGEDLTDTQDIGLTFTDLTSSEVGLKVILTYKLVNQFSEDVFNMIGRQMGDAMARKKDRDIIALFSGLNGGTALGGDNKEMALSGVAGCVAFAKAHKFISPISIVHHPNAVYYLTRSAAAIGATYYAGILGSLSEDIMRNFWKINVSGVNVFEDGNIDKIAAVDSGYGAVFSKSAMAYVESYNWLKETEKDISLRAYEVVITSDYGCFELDDTLGASCQYEIGDVATT